jgi:uncharacterized protein (DUF58 family)
MARTAVLPASSRTPQPVTAGAALDVAARLPRIMLEARRVAASISGVHGRRRAGPGETFWQFRPLLAGESASRIDWRRSARDGRLFVREREWEAAHTAQMWIDRSASMGFASSLARAPKIEQALIAGLALAEALVEAGERVALMGLTAPSASQRVVEKMAEAMAADQAGLSADLPPAMTLPPQTEAILVTDALTPAPAFVERLSQIAQRGAKGHLVIIRDPIEETFPFSGQAELFDLEDGLSLRIGDSDSWRQDYLTRLAAHHEALKLACDRLGWSIAVHRTDKPVTDIVLATMMRISAARHGG